jgi:hypothetical protein
MYTMQLKDGTDAIIPATPREWELYSKSMKCSRPARALTMALKRAIQHLEKEPSTSVYDLETQYMNPVYDKYYEFGANDSEPRGHAYNALKRVRNRLLGR